MTIADQTKIHERTAAVSTSRAVTEPLLSSKNIKQSGFQSMLIKTIENSQSSIAQQSRARNSEARYSSDAQPKLSAQETEASRASAAKVAAPDALKHDIRAKDVAYQHTTIKEGGSQNINAVNRKYFSEHLEMQNRFVNTDVNIDATQPSLSPAVSVIVKALDDQKYKNSYSSDHAKSLDSQLQEDRLIQEAIIHAKIQHLESSHVQDDLTASDEGAVIASEQSTNKLISLSSDYARDIPKSLVNYAIQSYVGTEQWSREVRQKIVWMFGIGQQSATLTLNPPHLGPLHINIRMQNNIAHTTFSSNDLGVRKALTEGMVLLSEMMSQKGLVLGGMTMTEINQEILKDEG